MKMKKRVSMLLAALLLCVLTANAAAEPLENRFSVESLYAYASAKGSPAFDLTMFSADDTDTFEEWQYTTYDSSMQYEFEKDAVKGYADLSFFLVGGSDTFVIPFLYLDGHSDQKFSVKLVEILVGDRIYWMDCKRLKDHITLEKDGDEYDFDLIFTLGAPGFALMNDLYDANFAFSLRVYDAKKLCFEINQPAVEDREGGYRVFYEGLLHSDLIDKNGLIQDGIGLILQKAEDEGVTPSIQLYPMSEKLWLPEGKKGLPKTSKSIKAIEGVLWEPHLSVEYTNTGDWGRVKSVPWLKIELRNTDKKRAVSSVTFVYYCTEKNGEKLYSSETGELYNEMTIEETIRAGKKKMLPKTMLEGYGKEATVVYTAIRKVTFADGSEEAVSDRDLFFTQWNVK